MKKLSLSFLILFLVISVFFSGVKAQTTFDEGSGKYGTILNDLKKSLYEKGRVKKVTLDGKERLMFVSWVRDHIHTMKAYKYWEKDMASYIDFFMGRQTEKGMYFLKQWLPTLVKGMKYEMSDPLRWSSKNLLVKRPYSIDTWDFTSEPDSLKSVARLLYHIGNLPETPKGIMHGDNSGMFKASKQLSELFEAVGQSDAAREWDLQGDLFRQRLNSLCWNGKFYAHFIPEEPVPSHIKTDPVNSIGLSNTYSMNRGAPTREMAASIIKTYQEIGEKTKSESLAPWFGIYPSVKPHFGKYAVGEYMNGAVLPLVGGELCKAAFQNGFETYAVEQLKVAGQIMSKNNQRLPGCVNGDGTAQKEAIPDEWGEAAFVSALVEGLAGVVDQSILFREVEISPRWYFTGVEKTSVNVGYGSDGNQVSYKYEFNPKNNQVKITTEGKFDRFTLRVPIPERLKSASASANGRNVKVVVDQVNQSRYAMLKGEGNSNRIVVKFQ